MIVLYTRENRPIAEKQRVKFNNGREEKLDRNSDAASGKKSTVELASVFKETGHKFSIYFLFVRHVTGNDQDYLRKIPRVVVQISALL